MFESLTESELIAVRDAKNAISKVTEQIQSVKKSISSACSDVDLLVSGFSKLSDSVGKIDNATFDDSIDFSGIERLKESVFTGKLKIEDLCKSINELSDAISDISNLASEFENALIESVEEYEEMVNE